MHHDLAQFLLIAAIVAAGLVILVPLGVYLVHKVFAFDWPPLYEWQQARRQPTATIRPAAPRWLTLSSPTRATARPPPSGHWTGSGRGGEPWRRFTAAFWLLSGRRLPPRTVSSESSTASRRLVSRASRSLTGSVPGQQGAKLSRWPGSRQRLRTATHVHEMLRPRSGRSQGCRTQHDKVGVPLAGHRHHAVAGYPWDGAGASGTRANVLPGREPSPAVSRSPVSRRDRRTVLARTPRPERPEPVPRSASGTSLGAQRQKTARQPCRGTLVQHSRSGVRAGVGSDHAVTGARKWPFRSPAPPAGHAPAAPAPAKAPAQPWQRPRRLLQVTTSERMTALKMPQTAEYGCLPVK